MNKLNLTALIVVLATLTMGCDTPDSANDVQTVTHTVTFDSQGGSEVESQDVANGGLITQPATPPTKSGFTFNGWYSDEGLTQPWNFAGNTVNSALTLYAGWVSETTHTVTFDSNGGSAVESQNVAEGGLITQPATPPTKSGFTFNGWYSDEGLTQPWNFAGNTVNGSLTLYAGWVSQTTHTVTFDSNGGSTVESQDVADGGKVAEPATPTRSGYVFKGWYSDSGLTQLWNFAGNTVNGTLTLYAGWEGGNVPTHTVTFDTNWGSVIYSQDVSAGDHAIEPDTPTRTGYTFKGWYSDIGLTQVWDFETDTVTAPLTLYVKWEYDDGELNIGDEGPAGGIVFYTKDNYAYGWRYMEAAPSDMSKTIQWGGYSNEVGGTFQDIGKGKANTEAIVKKLGAGEYAAQLCNDYVLNNYYDWFLPSVNELNELRKLQDTVGGFVTDIYWSSSESSNIYAWRINFRNGQALPTNKSFNYRIRAVRAF